MRDKNAIDNSDKSADKGEGAFEFTIERLQEADVASAVRLLSSAFNRGMIAASIEMDIALCDSFNRAVFCAKRDDQVIGVVSCQRQPLEDDAFFILANLAVHQNVRRQGVGDILREFGENFMKDTWSKDKTGVFCAVDNGTTYLAKRGYQQWDDDQPAAAPAEKAPMLYKWFNL